MFVVSVVVLRARAPLRRPDPDHDAGGGHAEGHRADARLPRSRSPVARPVLALREPRDSGRLRPLGALPPSRHGPHSPSGYAATLELGGLAVLIVIAVALPSASIRRSGAGARSTMSRAVSPPSGRRCPPRCRLEVMQSFDRELWLRDSERSFGGCSIGVAFIARDNPGGAVAGLLRYLTHPGCRGGLGLSAFWLGLVSVLVLVRGVALSASAAAHLGRGTPRARPLATHHARVVSLSPWGSMRLTSPRDARRARDQE